MESIPLQGKTYLVTGATDGIGRVTAERLDLMGAHMVLVGRNAAKAAQTAEENRQRTGRENVDFLVADLSEQAQVRRLAQEIRDRYERLDVLVNNAGAVFMQRQVSKDGLEMTFALNHLGYFLLTNLLLDLLKSSAPARIVNVSSMAHAGAQLNFDDLQNEASYSSWKVYGQSKLANIYFTYELARRLEGSNVTVNALHPGFVSTNFGRSNGGIFGPLFRLVQVAAISPDSGAETSIYLASSPEVEGVSGKYFDKKKPIRSSAVSYDQAAARRLWEMSEELTGISIQA